MDAEMLKKHREYFEAQEAANTMPAEMFGEMADGPLNIDLVDLKVMPEVLMVPPAENFTFRFQGANGEFVSLNFATGQVETNLGDGEARALMVEVMQEAFRQYGAPEPMRQQMPRSGE